MASGMAQKLSRRECLQALGLGVVSAGVASAQRSRKPNVLMIAVDETVAEFDDVVGLENLACIHLNDSKHACGTNKDEHAHVGEGEIGEDGMRAVINHDDLRDLPYVLETPTEDGKGFDWNVERVKELRD